MTPSRTPERTALRLASRPRDSALTTLLGLAVLAVVAMMAMTMIVGANGDGRTRQVADAASSFTASTARTVDGSAGATRTAAGSVQPGSPR